MYATRPSPDGKYLYFSSNRHENTVPSDIEFDFAILKSMGVYAIPLARDTASPVAPKSDEADSGPDRDEKAEKSDGDAAAGKAGGENRKAGGRAPPDHIGPIAPIRIDIDGMHYAAVLDQHETVVAAELDFLRRHLLDDDLGEDQPALA